MIARKFLAVALCAASVAASAARPTWSISDTGSFGTNIAQGTAVNNRGQVVGTSNKIILPYHWAGISRCFLWENGTMQDIGTPSFDFCQARAINDDGTILASTGYAGQAYLWKDGQWTFAAPTSPTAMNRFNAIVGQYWNGANYRGYYVRDGVFVEIGTLGGGISSANSVNDKGYVVGVASVNDTLGIIHAYVWKDGVMTDLGTLPGKEDSYAADINNHGVIVGYSGTTWNDRTAFIADVNGGMLPLGISGWSEPTAINDRGAVVGRANDKAFLYDNGTLLYLEDIPEVRAAGWTFLCPLDINDRGWITGYGSHGTGLAGFVLIPK